MAKNEKQAEVMSVKELEADKLSALELYISQLEDKEGSLIHVLHKAQELFGFLPKELQLFVARKLGIPGAKVFGVVSFYSYFTTKPQGEHVISVCMGTACFVKGVDKVADAFKEQLGIEQEEMTPDGKFTLKSVRCIGACGLAPVVLVDDKVFGHVTADDVSGIIEEYQKEEEHAN